MATTYIRSYEHENQASVYRNIYGWMTMALVVTALASLVSAQWLESSVAYQTFYFQQGGMWMLLIAPIVLVFVLSGMIHKLSFPAATAIFAAYAILMGLSLSPLLLVYTQVSIATTFFISAGMFGAMAAYGYITKSNLSTWGHFLFMALIGLIIASVVNLFLHSEKMDYVVSFIGILIFSGLTAYDSQKFKQLLAGYEGEITDEVKKIALIGALQLYLDFINLFLYLLRIFGKRR